LFIVTSSATDNAGNAQTLISSVTLQFQPPPAQTGILQPASLGFYNALTQLNGTANANTTQIQLQIQNNATGLCWSGSSGTGWTSCPQIRTLNGPGASWIYPFGADVMPNWSAVNNSSFTLTETGYNLAGLAEAGPPGNSVTFSVDMSSPVTRVTFPSNNGAIRTFPTLAGTALDPGPVFGAGVVQAAGVQDPGGVHVELQRTDNNYYWNQALSTWTVAAPAFAQSTASFVAGSGGNPGTWGFQAA